MQQKSTHIIQELQEISPVVANLNNYNAYTVPPDYFNNLASEILQQIRTNELLEQAKGNPFIAPNGYFTTFASTLAEKMQEPKNYCTEVENELNEVAPILNTIDKNNIYSIPSNYFIDSANTIKLSKEAKVIGLPQVTKWFKYAVAAIFIGVLAVGIIYFISPNTNEINIEQAVSKTSDEEINNYLTSAPNTDIIVSTNIIDETESLGLFDATSTEEIKLYLNEQPEMVENTN
ncbi:MAG: hypothetical protein MUE72_03875 [Chitinophagaceae bacterium]|jgi:hypothetical protein|nr:hypothetical protein [Chitinophagaceae bacterium]